LTQTTLRFLAVAVLALGGICDHWAYADPSPASPQALELEYKDSGKTFVVSVGQRIHLFIGTAGPTQYSEPHISSAALRLIDSKYPRYPGGKFATYTFEAVSPGQARIGCDLQYPGDAKGKPVYIRNGNNPHWYVKIQVRKN
jgi:hypothetical protein